MTERQLTSSGELLILCGLVATYHQQSISFNDKEQDYFGNFKTFIISSSEKSTCNFSHDKVYNKEISEATA